MGFDQPGFDLAQPVLRQLEQAGQAIGAMNLLIAAHALALAAPKVIAYSPVSVGELINVLEAHHAHLKSAQLSPSAAVNTTSASPPSRGNALKARSSSSTSQIRRPSATRGRGIRFCATSFRKKDGDKET